MRTFFLKSFCCFLIVILFSHKLQSQEDIIYKKFKDSLFYGPRVTSLSEVLKNLNSLIKTTTNIKKAQLYKIKKLHPLIELEQLNNALQLTNNLIEEVTEDLEVTVRNRRALIYEFLGNFEKAKKELDLAKLLYEEKKVKKDQEYGALLYRYASLYRVHKKPKEALQYINKAIIFGETNNYYDVTTVSYLVKALIVGKKYHDSVFKNLLLEALKYARLSKNKFHIRSIYSNLARYYQRKGALKTTLVYTDSILYYDNLLHQSFAGIRSYLIKSECYATLGKPKLALKNYEIFHKRTLEEKISKEKISISELEYNFSLEKEKIKRDQVFTDNQLIKAKNQNLIWFLISLFSLFIVLVTATILILRRNKIIRNNREEIAISNKLLLKGLKEKEVLLKEVHHRVKNNLMLIISLVDFQTQEIDHKTHKERYLSLKKRIEAIAILHEQMLIKSDKGLDDNYNINRYINKIIDSLSSLHPQKVDFIDEIEAIDVNLDVAVPLGMLLNELISNSLKHNYNSKVKIEIKITEQNEYLNILYKDSGEFVKTINNERKSMGVFIVESMVKQLKGTLKRENTTYSIKVRKQK